MFSFALTSRGGCASDPAGWPSDNDDIDSSVLCDTKLDHLAHIGDRLPVVCAQDAERVLSIGESGKVADGIP